MKAVRKLPSSRQGGTFQSSQHQKAEIDRVLLKPARDIWWVQGQCGLQSETLSQILSWRCSSRVEYLLSIPKILYLTANTKKKKGKEKMKYLSYYFETANRWLEAGFILKWNLNLEKRCSMCLAVITTATAAGVWCREGSDRCVSCSFKN